ncbi:MAG: hydantoinase/oxoprolinase family protein [Alphaproteobacteria bacterium]|nr:hydantoinase/oxoprolinase family protein [Alphaproteobacteria bacterium]
MAHLIGVDVGGTNTDLVFVDTEAGELRVAKVPSTPSNQADGLMHGIDILDVPLKEIDLLIHGTTVATNAVIERKGARCGLITTKGFRDVLELGRRDRRQVYGLFGDFQPLIDRQDRREVDERVSAQGEILTPLDPEEVRAVASALAEEGCEALVISFMHAYANTGNEAAAGRAAREVWPNDFVVTSSEVLPVVREFERTSTATVSGYVQPLISRYLTSLGDRLNEGGYVREFLVVQLNGGVMTASVAARLASNTILSGPAAGVTAGAAIAVDMDIGDVVCCDMGGTSFDACIIRGGQPVIANEKYLDFRIPLSLPMLDVDAIGAGGGSIARIDSSGIIEVGPESAGADPGPACVGHGGTEPTVTDASLVLGYLDPGEAIGRDEGVGMDVELARAAIQEKIAGPLNLAVEDAAEAILTVTGAKMAGHVRRNLLGKGLDPREFSVIAFGGAGPVHVNRITREVGFRSAIIPAYPGLTSALGCVLGRLRHDYLRTVNVALDTLDPAALGTIFDEEVRKGRTLLKAEGVPADRITATLGADMCYAGQAYVIQVIFPDDEALSTDSISEAFEAAYHERFANLLPHAGIKIISTRVTVASTEDVPSVADLVSAPTDTSPTARTTRAYFGGGWVDAAKYRRGELPAEFRVDGPALLTQPDSTTLIEPGFSATVHPTGNLLIEANT